MLFDLKIEPRTGQPLWGTWNNIVRAVGIWPDSGWYLRLNFQVVWSVFLPLICSTETICSRPWIHLSPFEQCDGDWVSEVIFPRLLSLMFPSLSQRINVNAATPDKIRNLLIAWHHKTRGKSVAIWAGRDYIPYLPKQQIRRRWAFWGALSLDKCSIGLNRYIPD